MSKDIKLVKIDSAEKDTFFALSAAVDAPDQESLDIISRKEIAGFYEHTKLSQFGDFMIMLNGELAGQICLNASQDSNFTSNKIVNIEFSYGLLDTCKSKGVMTEVLKLAIQHIQAVKDAHQDIIFVEYDGCTPEKHELLTAQAIGEVCAHVMDMSNYPSLSCCIKAGGKVTGLTGDFIDVTFLNQESDPHFSEAFTSALMSYSQKLCQLGFDGSYSTNPPDDVEKHKASEASKILIRQAEDIITQVAILSFVKLRMVEFAQDWVQDVSMKPILEAIKAKGLYYYAPEFFVDEVAHFDVASPDISRSF